MSTNRVNIVKNAKDPHARYQMEKMDLHTVNKHGFKTVFRNINTVARDLNVLPSYIVKYFNLSLGLKCNYDEHEGMSVNCKKQINADIWQATLEKFIKELVMCRAPQCGLPECYMIVNGEQVLLHCTACGTEGPVKTNEKMLAFIQKTPPFKRHIQVKEEQFDFGGIQLPQDDDDEWSEEEVSPTDKMKSFLENAESLSSKKVIAQVRSIAEEYSLDEKQIVCLMMESFFDENMLEQLDNFASTLKRFIKGSTLQKIVLGYVEEMVSKYPELLKQVPEILQKLFDAEIIQVKAIRAWYEKSTSRFADEKVVAQVRVAAKSFVSQLE
jgi:translation initiation factor 5